jgi:hypothetical protein
MQIDPGVHETRSLPFTTDKLVMFYVRGWVYLKKGRGRQPEVINVCPYEWVRVPAGSWVFIPDTPAVRRKLKAG